MAHILPYWISVRITSSDCPAVFPTGLLPRLHAAFHSAPMLSTRVPTVLSYCSTGISTCCPSDTLFSLSLGPDLPGADQLYSGNLRYSALNNASSAGLRILSSSTCVGLRYGHALHNSSFSRHMAHTLCYFISLHITSSDYTTDLPIVHLPRLYRFFHSRPVLSTCVPTVLIMRGTGI